ncbi:MAG: hydrogenase formation protein HypD [Defluviitaleaceae bacterium]|nr:hydrogenase formation protein HypD [Defluviitaleaceae bacterium]
MNLEAITDYLRDYRGNVKIMEVCGTHTSSIVKNGIRPLLAGGIRLVSGPGCPVCVTPASDIDALIDLAEEAEILSFGDMFRVPGCGVSLSDAKARGAKVRLMYSPFEVIPLAKSRPENRFVVAAVGFETTAPVYAALLEALERENIENVTLYTALKTMPEILDYVCSTEAVDGFISPGHVSAVIGGAAYEPLCEKFGKPFVIAGFEAGHILAAIYDIARQIEAGRHEVKNLYPSVVSRGGQTAALALIDKYFEKSDSFWRGIGLIKGSGYAIRGEYARFSANRAYNETQNNPYAEISEALPAGCRCADVMLGRILPDECPLFGKACTPRHPVGACMVSSEGACGVWERGF